MPEEEQESLLGSLANRGASGLSAVGWLFDTPGAVIRGGLSGGPMKAISALVESSEDRVTGRELLRQYGLVGDEDTWGNFAGGLAAEMALDPLTYLNPFALLGRGAVTTTGRALQRAGVLEDAALLARRSDKGIRRFLRDNTGEDILQAYAGGDAAKLASARERFEDAASILGADSQDLLGRRAASSMEFRLPGMQTGVPVSLTGGRAGDAVASFFDTVGDGMKTNPLLGPIANRATAFFDTSVRGAIDPDAQWRNREASALARDNTRRVREEMGRLEFDALRASHSSGLKFTDQRIQNAIGDLVEAGGDGSRLIDTDAAQAVLSTPEWKAVVDDFITRNQDAKLSADLLGAKLKTWEGADDTQFMPSQSVWFDSPSPPKVGDRLPRSEQPYGRGQRALNLDDNFARGRNPAYNLPMRRQAFRQLMSGDFGRELQQRLIAARDEDIPAIIDEAWEQLNQRTGGKMGQLYGPPPQDAIDQIDLQLQTQGVLSPDGRDALLGRRDALGGKLERLAQQKIRLGDLLRRADTQFADSGIGLFDGSAFNDMLRYSTGRAGVEANAKVVGDTLFAEARRAGGSGSQGFVGGGYISLGDAARSLGLDETTFSALAAREGFDPATASVREDVVNSLKSLLPQAPQRTESPAGKLFRSFTNAFKIGALANPAYHFRNLYSGLFGTLTQNITNPISLGRNAFAGFRAGQGQYGPLLARIRNIPRYQRAAQSYRALNPAATEAMVDDAILRQFMGEASRNRIGQNSIVSEIDAATDTPGLFPGAGYQRRPLFGRGGRIYDPNRSLPEWMTVRGVDFAGTMRDTPGPRQTLNPLLQLHEDVGAGVENANRLGTYLSALEKGASPDEAANLVYRSQVDYSPEAYTAGERALKRFVPFYSYPRGITPLIAENMLYRPGGLQQQSIRGVTRGTQSDGDAFLPEHLRQSAAIPLPFGSPDPNLQRVLTNIDLPYEGVLNLLSPGYGSSTTQAVLDTIRRTGMNLMGQLNPLVKYPLENLFDRQLYSGRELSDLYSVLEKDIGPLGAPLEQAIVNLVPGGSKLNAIYRTLRDERLSPAERAAKVAFNNLFGVKVTDIDQERAKQRAARDALNQILSTTAGAKTYENITIPEEALLDLPKEQRDMYLMYRIIQSEAAKRARERKQAEIDPLQVLIGGG